MAICFKISNFFKYHYYKSFPSNFKSKFLCTFPKVEFVILSDGRITSCCIDAKGDNTYYSIYDNYNNNFFRNYKNFLYKFAINNHIFPVCINCYKYSKLAFHKDNLNHYDYLDFLKINTLPTQIAIELTSKCNLTCIDCITGKNETIKYRDNNRSPYIQIDKLKEFLKPFIKNINSIRLFNYGETFLHPKSFDFINFLINENNKIHISIATNLLMLNTKNKITDIVRIQPDVLYISLHGYDQSSTEKYMGKNCDFIKTINIMKDIINYRNELKQNLPLVIWKYLLFNWNDDDEHIETAIAIAKENNIDYLGFDFAYGIHKSNKYYEGSEELNKLKNSDYWMPNIYSKTLGFKRVIY